ncbi:MAG: hypothetical protein M5U09_09405 [Gammaproteobacteria bacterium]|nr:hypothetical protein [Gammaproteobacteria bacterium]
MADLVPLFEAAADSRNYKLLIGAAIFQSTAIGNGDRALALLGQAMEMAPQQLVPRLKYIEALTQARPHGRKHGNCCSPWRLTVFARSAPGGTGSRG